MNELKLNSRWGVTTDSNSITTLPIGEYRDWYHPNLYRPFVEKYYPLYSPVWNEEKNKTEQAFKIAEKLIHTQKAYAKTVKDFIELVNDIIAVL